MVIHYHLPSWLIDQRFRINLPSNTKPPAHMLGSEHHLQHRCWRQRRVPLAGLTHAWTPPFSSPRGPQNGYLYYSKLKKMMTGGTPGLRNYYIYNYIETIYINTWRDPQFMIVYCRLLFSAKGKTCSRLSGCPKVAIIMQIWT